MISSCHICFTELCDRGIAFCFCWCFCPYVHRPVLNFHWSLVPNVPRVWLFPTVTVAYCGDFFGFVRHIHVEVSWVMGVAQVTMGFNGFYVPMTWMKTGGTPMTYRKLLSTFGETHPVENVCGFSKALPLRLELRWAPSPRNEIIDAVSWCGDSSLTRPECGMDLTVFQGISDLRKRASAQSEACGFRCFPLCQVFHWLRSGCSLQIW